MSVETVVLIVAFGIAVGVFSALFGIGGGGLMVPFMVLALDYTQHTAEGTSLLAIVPIALVGVISHQRNGFVDFRVAAWLGLGGAIGALGGALLGLELEADLLQMMFAVFVALVGVRLIRDGLKKPESDAAASG